MKRFFMMVVVLSMAAGICFAQDAKQIIKERKAIAKLAKSELREKATKDARKEAKKLEKDGWVTFPGDLPLAKQLDRSYAMEYEYVQTAGGSVAPKYLVGRAIAKGENYSAAQNAAVEIAKQYVAGLAEIDITTITETTLGNKEEATVASLAEVISASKNIVSKKLAEVQPIVTLRRDTKDKNIEVLVRVVYDRNTVLQTYKETIREQLEQKGDKLHDQLDRVLGF